MIFRQKRETNLIRLSVSKLVGLICLSISAWAIGPLQSSSHFENKGGLIDHISPLLVPPNNATDLNNITMDDRGMLSTRMGYVIKNTTGALSTNAITGGGGNTYIDGHTDFIVVVGTNAFRTTNSFGGSFTNITASTLSITNSAANIAQTTGFNNVLVFCNESDKPFYAPTTGNAVQISTGLFTGAKTCSTYGSYLVIGNTTESSVNFPNRVRWSNINDQNDFPANNYTDVEPNDGDKIVSMVTYDDSVYIFKHHSIYRMLITGLDGADAFLVRPVVRNIGAWAKNSVKVIPNVGIAFLAQNTAYVLNDSGLEPIGDPIQRTFDGISRAMWPRIVGEVYPKRYQYWLAISTNGSTNTEALVYDYIQKAWSVYSGMTINMLSTAESNTGQLLLISGDTSGNIYQQDSGTFDQPRNVTTAITSSYTTGDLTLGSPDFTKNFKYLYIFTQQSSTTSLTVDAAFDYSTSYEYSQDVTLGSVTAVYDTAIYDTDTYASSGNTVQRFEINRSARAIKLRFTSASTSAGISTIGWTLVFSNEDWRQ